MFRLPHLGIISFIFCSIFSVSKSYAEDTACPDASRSCALSVLEKTVKSIEDERWRDRALRELAKSYASNNQAGAAIPLIALIQNPDTKALTIRGIGMNAAELGLGHSVYKDLFSKLDGEAQKIEHEASQAIAYTYIGMAQSYSGLDDDAIETALAMDNPALQNKALGEIAEIQAAHGKADLAFKTLVLIKDFSFRNKAYRVVSKIFAQEKQYKHAFDASMLNENLTSRAESLQSLLYEMEKHSKGEE